MGNHESSEVPRGGCVVAIEGNIGAGKTTLCRTLMERLGGEDKVVILKEEIVGHKLLDLYYAEPQRYAYDLHVLTTDLNLLAMQKARALADEGKIVLLDRCLLGVWVFINANLGNMTPQQSVDLINYFREKLAIAPAPDRIIYLNTCPDQCLINTQKRGRGCDSTVAIDYLCHLDQYYREIINQWENVPVMTMEFDLIRDEDIALIKASRPYLIPPVKNEDTGGDDSDTEPLPGGWSFTDEKAD
jgi:deoxyadenosine/deoxycytidine kinase